MEYAILILVCVMILCSIGIYFAYKFLQKKKQITAMQKNAPKEVLDIFNEAEKNMKGGIKEDGTTESPYGILWKIAREKSGRRTNSREQNTDAAEPITSSGELHEQPSGRQDIQTRTTTDTNKDKPIVRKPKPINIGRIVSRIRRRKS